MADKRLSEVTKVTDMAYVPVILSDGSVGQIAKADLASVVAGVLKTNTLDSSKTNVDLDTLQNTQNYLISSDATNLPVKAWGILSVVGNGNDVTQQFFSYNVWAAWCRTKNAGGSWSSWIRLDNFGYNTLAELSAGVAKNDPTRINSIQGKRLVKIGACSKWSQGSFIASVANASGYHCGVLGISYRHMDTSQNVSYSFSGAEPVGIEIYKKLNNGVLEVYIYSTTSQDSINPMLGLSTHNLEPMGVVTDLSSYTLVASL